MLTALDETLHHQVPLTFDHVMTSDHRFYDRQLMGGFRRDGSLAFLAAITFFKNMNVAEGFVMIQRDSAQQYNVRLTKQLRPLPVDGSTKVGPLRLEIVRPFEELRFTLEVGDHPIALDITYRNILPAHLEAAHFSRLDGRMDSDYMRYHQLGTISGSLTVEGVKYEADNWYGWRDHSWGVRPNVGGYEPSTGTKTVGGVSAASRTGGKGLFMFYLGFWNGREGGSFSVIEDGDGGRVYTNGQVSKADGAHLAVVGVDYDVTFKPGTRVFETLDTRLTLEDGSLWRVKATSVGRPWVYRGGGYDSGFEDGKAQGVYRSRDLLIEADEYDITDPELVIFPDGTQQRPKHREQLSICEVNGLTGSAYAPMFVIGDHPRFGFRWDAEA